LQTCLRFRERPFQLGPLVSESEPQIPRWHSEMLPRHEQNALPGANLLDQVERFRTAAVANAANRTGFGRQPFEKAVKRLEPRVYHGEIGLQNAASPFQDFGPGLD